MTKFTQTYPTDLKYTEWLLIMDFFPTNHLGRPRKWEMWQILNAILYVVRTGCQWRMLPTNLPPWQTVYGSFRRWKKNGLWERSMKSWSRQFASRMGVNQNRAQAYWIARASKHPKEANSEALISINRLLGKNATL